MDHPEQLASPGKLSVTTPTLIENLKAKAVFCGDLHTVVIDLDDNVFVTGNNDFGILGLDKSRKTVAGDKYHRYTFTLLPDIKAESIGCGDNHVIIIAKTLSGQYKLS